MLDFLGKRLQKSLSKIKVKTRLEANDINEVSRSIKMALLEADVNLIVVKTFIKKVKAKALKAEVIQSLDPSQQVIKIVKEELQTILGSNTKEFVLKGNLPIVMMTGLQGTGKTTSCAKVVKYAMKKNNVEKPLMIAGDIYRPAAIDQLVDLGKQLNIDVFSIKDSKDPVDIVKKGLEKAQNEKYDLVLIDTAGRLSIDEKLMQEVADIKKVAKPQEIFFVVDALAGQEVINVAKTFHDKLSLTGTLITKLDSDARGGAALSICQMLNLPIRFIGTGEKITNLDLFHPERMAKRILGMGDVLSLIEKAQDVIDEKKSQKMMNRMFSGSFNLNDLLEQLKQMKKLGKMSKIIKLIPGVANKIDKNQISSAEQKLYLYEILIHSMTKQEQRNPKLLKNASRKKRILEGSGRSAQEFNKLINEFERMSKQMKSMSSQMKDGTFNPSKMFGNNS